MAISLLATGFHQLHQRCAVDEVDEREPASAFMARGKIMTGLDIFLGVSAVVLGILALTGILPIPQSMVVPFSYAAIAGGALNGIVALAMKCCAGGCRSQETEYSRIEHSDDEEISTEDANGDKTVTEDANGGNTATEDESD